MAISSRRRTVLSAFLVVLLLLGCAGSFATFAPPQQPPDRIELSDGWQLASATRLGTDGATVSRADYAAKAGWHTIRRMPATVLEVLQDDGTYPNLYYGKNLLDEVPQDLYKQDWWYRTSFTAPAGHSTYLLELPGINYRAEVWLNGRLVADNTQIVGMFDAHELDVGRWLRPGESNTLAIKVTPERALQDIDGVELADSWWDWINWKYLGYQGPDKDVDRGNSFVSDRNAGIWKPVYLKVAGDVALGPAVVNTELPLPRTDSARLTVHTSVHNYSPQQLRGILKGTISRPGKPSIDFEQAVTLLPGEQREVTFSPDDFDDLTVANPDLWWPYTLGEPNLYDLALTFTQFGQVSDSVRAPVRHPDRLSTPGLRRRLPRSGQGRQLLSHRQRPGSSGQGSRIHARSALRLFPGTRGRDPALRQGPRPQHGAAGRQVPRRAHRREGR